MNISFALSLDSISCSTFSVHTYILTPIDIAKFFDTVEHDKLMTILGRTIKDGDVISVVRKFPASGVMIDDEYEDTIVGTPQGGNISPLLANIMLNELDKELEARGLDFVRYADDRAPRRRVQVA